MAKTFGRDVLHPEEFAYDATGSIPYTADGSKLSIKAADVIADRKY